MVLDVFNGPVVGGKDESALSLQLVGGIVGSRLDFLIQNWDDVSDDVLAALDA